MSKCSRSVMTKCGLTVFALFIFACTSACQIQDKAYQRTSIEKANPPHYTSRVNVFLSLNEKQGPASQFEIHDIEILTGDVWLPLIDQPLLIDSVKIGTGQLFLGAMALPPGEYRKIRLTVKTPQVQKPKEPQTAILSEATQKIIMMQEALTLEPGDSETLLFTWDVENSYKPDRNLDPQFIITPSMRQLRANTLYVTCPEINTIFVIRTDINWVVDSFGVPGQPTYLAVNPSYAQGLLYVLTSGDRMVKVVDIASQRVVDEYPTLNDEASYMTVSPDGQWAYLVHEKSGYLSRMNLLSGQVEERVMLGSRPNYAFYLRDQKLLAVSLLLSQNVHLLEPETLKIVRTYSTGMDPQGVLALDNQLYIAESGSSSIAAFDLSGSSNQARLMVGFGPRRLIETEDQVFVSNYEGGTLSVLVPGQLNVFQQIQGFGQPFEMVFNRFYRQLYVVDHGKEKISVVNSNSNQLTTDIVLGAKPLGMVVIQ